MAYLDTVRSPAQFRLRLRESCAGMVQWLAQTKRWEKIYSLSRRPPKVKVPGVEYIAMDLIKPSGEELAAQLASAGVAAESVLLLSSASS
jgi:hypothetical protein